MIRLAIIICTVYNMYIKVCINLSVYTHSNADLLDHGVDLNDLLKQQN